MTNLAVEMIIEGREKDLGGFKVRRVLPYARRRMVGPWIFVDHIGPATLPPGEGINVRPHPHIALATVTFLFEGAIHHRDSLGSDCVIRPGDINLMVAGHGIVHSEREVEETLNTTRRLSGLQLWLALPHEAEETDPAFYHYDAADIPFTGVDGVAVKVMMGEAFGLKSPVKTHSTTLYVEARLSAGQRFVVPAAQERCVYVCAGEIDIDGERLHVGQMAVLKPDVEVSFIADENAHIVVLGGDSVGERYIDWNFVASTKERIERAKADWKAGRFPIVPGDDQEFIPLPE